MLDRLLPKKYRPVRYIEVVWDNDDDTPTLPTRLYPGDTATFENRRGGGGALMRVKYDGKQLWLLPLCLMVRVEPAEARLYADAVTRRRMTA